MIPTIESLKIAYDACNQVRKDLAEIEPVDDLHREQIYRTLLKVDEIQTELKVRIEGRV